MCQEATFSRRFDPEAAHVTLEPEKFVVPFVKPLTLRKRTVI